jgi:hypothetical protein
MANTLIYLSLDVRVWRGTLVCWLEPATSDKELHHEIGQAPTGRTGR